MDAPHLWSILPAAGTFILGVVLAVISLRRRDRTELKACIEQEMDEHLDAEHTRDSEGRTLRERIGLSEAAILNLDRRCDERLEL